MIIESKAYGGPVHGQTIRGREPRVAVAPPVNLRNPPSPTEAIKVEHYRVVRIRTFQWEHFIWVHDTLTDEEGFDLWRKENP